MVAITNTDALLAQAVLAEASTHGAFKSPWSFLNVPSDVRGPIVDVARAISRLQREFSPELLQETGIVHRVANAPPCLAPELTYTAGALIPVVIGRARTPVAIQTARGRLPRLDSPFDAFHSDESVSGLSRRYGCTLVTPYQQECILLRGLGLPAVVVTGWHRLSPREILRFARMPCGETYPQEDAGSRIFLVGWSVGALSRQPLPAVVRIADHLIQARRHLNVDLASIAAWIPSPAEFESLRYRVRARDARSVRELLRQSIETPVDLEELAPAPTLVSSYPEALNALVAAMSGAGEIPGGERATARAWDAYHHAVQNDLVGPLLAWAMKSPQPLVQQLGIQIAGVAELLHRTTPAMIAAHASRSPSPFPGRDARGRSDLSDYLTLQRSFCFLVRELHRAQEA